MARVRDHEDLTPVLPTEAYHRGMTLTWWHPEALQVSADPVILELRGRELYRWDYTPSMIEVWGKVKELETAF